MNRARYSPHHRYQNDMEAGRDRENEEDDEEIASDPFDIPTTKTDSVALLKRWRQASLVLNASRRFHYTLDLKTQQEKEEIRRKFRSRVQVIRAALRFNAVEEQDTGSPNAPTSNGDYGIGPEELASATRDHNLADLEHLGRISIISDTMQFQSPLPLMQVYVQHQMPYTQPLAHQQFQNSQLQSGHVQHNIGQNQLSQSLPHQQFQSSQLQSGHVQHNIGQNQLTQVNQSSHLIQFAGSTNISLLNAAQALPNSEMQYSQLLAHQQWQGIQLQPGNIQHNIGQNQLTQGNQICHLSPFALTANSSSFNAPQTPPNSQVHMQPQMQYSHPFPHQPFQNSQLQSGHVQHYIGQNPLPQGTSHLNQFVGTADSSLLNAARTLPNSQMESGHSSEEANALFLNNVVTLSTCLVTIGTAGSFSFFQLNSNPKGPGDASLNHILEAVNVLLCASSLIAYVVALIFSLSRHFPGKILILKIILGCAVVSFVLGYILVAVFNIRRK